jgi:hypothetical protein
MSSWHPLLTGPLAERAWQAIDEIAAAIAPGAALPHTLDETMAGAVAAGEPVAEPRHPSVAGGISGQALFFAYRSQSERATPADATAAGELLDEATGALATLPMLPDLYGGFAGVAWTAQHLYDPRFAEPASGDAAAGAGDGPADDSDDGGDGGDGGDDDPLVEIDAALLQYLERTPWTADYDLIRGLAGFGVYALERLPRPSALTCLSAVLDRLTETAEPGPRGGITWHTSEELLPEWQRKLYPKGYYNLGAAHGVPGPIAVLGAAVAAAGRLAEAGDPAAREVARRARSLVEGAVEWLVQQRLPAGEESWFGTTFAPDTPPQKSRLAWCYGDPGIAATLMVAARACREPAWEKLAVDLAVSAAARPFEGSLIRDAGLCHGSGGLGHLFNRLYQQTGDPRLAESSRGWYQHALDFRQPGEGLAGYRAFWVEEDGVTQSWRSDAGFLEGVAGIGLALLAGVSAFEPNWDRLVVVSAATEPVLPPR